MKNKIAALLFLSLSYNLDAKITNIFVDVNLLLETCTKAATKEVGIWDSTKYTTYMGKTPNKADYFKSLKNCPAQSDQQTYNEDLVMPPILCDWLLGLQTNSTVKTTIFNHLTKSSLSNIEKTIYKNIATMMVTPKTFVGTQLVKKDVAKMIQKLLQSSQYTVRIIGNWDKESEPFLIKLLQTQLSIDTKNCIFSNKLQQLKPNDGYYSALVCHCNVNPKECLVIDTEKKHVQGAKTIGMTSVLIQGQSASQLKTELCKHKIQV